MRFLRSDLKARNMDVLRENLVSKQKRLLEIMETEFQYIQLRSKIEHGEKGLDSAVFLLLDCVPCILHMEMRIGIKILTRQLTVGFANYKEGHPDIAENIVLQQFLEGVQHVVNTRIWGSGTNPSHWECPTTEDGKNIGTITMDGEKTRKIMDQFELIIEHCMTGSAEKCQQWKECVVYYRKGMEILRQKEDFTDQGILGFQKVGDQFYAAWMDLNGSDGVTNYIHMWGAGHLCGYLHYWRNFYVHSQQGLEAFNNLVKLFYLQRTQRGGASGQGKGVKDRLKPLGRWMQNRYLW